MESWLKIVEMLAIGGLVVVAPPIGRIYFFDQGLGHESLKGAEKNDVVLSMEVNPASIAVIPIVLLETAGTGIVPDVVEGGVMNVAQYAVEVLTDGNIAACVNYRLTGD